MPWTRVPEQEQDPSVSGDPASTGRVIGYVQAINEALGTALQSDPRVFVMGQGVEEAAGAMFGTTAGLEGRFGSERVFDTPVSEEGMTGVSVGAAINGLRPFYMHNRPDFLLLAFNQIVGHASKFHFMSNGRTRVPLVIWAAIGRGWGSGAQHSQAIQGLLLGVPGLKIIMPSTPFDSKGLTLAAIADPNPVLIFEHRWLMKQRGSVPEQPYRIPIGKAAYRRRGDALSIIGSSHALDQAMRALDSFDGKVRADVIDLRTIKPLDEATILESVRKTGRVLIVDTGWAMGGVCAEIGCLIAEKAFSALKAPVRRIGLPDLPAPAGSALEDAYYPGPARIREAIQELVKS